jgi:DmsE family decaheme c-type cytochrome
MKKMQLYTGARSCLARYALPAIFVLLLGGLSGPRGDAQAAEKAPAPAKVAGADLCIACHAQVPGDQKQDWHARQIAARPGSSNCEECHGPSAAHTEDPGNTATFHNVTRAPAVRGTQACLRCHQDRVKPALWKSSEHAQGNVRCWDCHSQGSSPHRETLRRPDSRVCYACHPEQRGTFELTSHHPVNEGRVDCVDCHDPHQHQSGADKVKNCTNCHAAQRGPFLFAHGSISGELTDGCLDCHRAHGSPNERLHKFAGRGLCLQCHADHVLHFVGRTCWDSDCHTGTHGSNSSPILLGE